MEAHDSLTYHVKIDRPKGCKIRFIDVWIADCADVVGERVEPHINHVTGVSGQPGFPKISWCGRSTDPARKKLMTSLRRLPGAIALGFA